MQIGGEVHACRVAERSVDRQELPKCAERSPHTAASSALHSVGDFCMSSSDPLQSKDHETIARTFRETVELANDSGDVVTADLLTERIYAHDKAAWMFRATIAQDPPANPSH
ncbi:MAG: ferritin-like domain-containing protein [Steroidobacteraceae bacterium]